MHSPSPHREARFDRRRDDRGDDRNDSFYRGRSSGTGRHERRRSRSPAQFDRYEARPRRDERDRDDRRRLTPPSNIDRYVPGQTPSAPPSVSNPIADPVTLPFQVGFSYFGAWWRENEKVKEELERAKTGRRREPRESQTDPDAERAVIQAAYDDYKIELLGKNSRKFVSDHKGEAWFRERYVSELQAAIRERMSKLSKSAYTQWEQDLSLGVFDKFSLDGIPKNDVNTAGEEVEKDAGEVNEVLGVGDLVPATDQEFHDEKLAQPTLLLKTIAPNVSRDALEAFCKEHLGDSEGGFHSLSLSEPNPSKRFHRIGWVTLHPSSESTPSFDREEPDGEENIETTDAAAPASTAERAVEAVNGKTVKDELRGDFICHVGVHTSTSMVRKKALWDLFSAPERIDRDLDLVWSVVEKFERDVSVPNGASSLVSNKVDELKETLGQGSNTSSPDVSMDTKGEFDEGRELTEVDERMSENGEEEAGQPSDSRWSKKKQLDLLVEYLRRVFNFCFYCVYEGDSIHDLNRKCPGGHLRRPRSTLTAVSRAVASATVTGEPFPNLPKDKPEPVDEGEILEEEAKKKGRHPVSKTEVQLLRAYNWVKTFEDKLNQFLNPSSCDVKKLGGVQIEEATEEEFDKHVKKEDDHKWRCKLADCTKLFKEKHFWKKHVEKRHTEWLEELKQELELVNAYVLDPSHVTAPRVDGNTTGRYPHGSNQNLIGTPRGFNLQSLYVGGMMNMPENKMNPRQFSSMFANGQGGGQFNGDGIERGGGPVRMSGGRGQFRSGPYDRRGGGGRGRGGSRWGDGAGGATGGPAEAVQGRSLKSYEDLDQVGGSGSKELNY